MCFRDNGYVCSGSRWHFIEISLPVQVIFPFVDVFSDIFTAYTFFSGGDPVWGSITLAIVFVPAVVWCVSVGVTFCLG